jgi:hypothetical protein
MSVSGRAHRTAAAAFGLVALAAVVAPLAVGLTPDRDGLELAWGTRLPELCMSKRLTGEPCGSCGMGRSYVLAVHGDLGQSLALHPGGALLWCWLLAQSAFHLGLACTRLDGRRGPLDLVLTLLSFLALSAVMALVS